jgi:hypothetical protein
MHGQRPHALKGSALRSVTDVTSGEPRREIPLASGERVDRVMVGHVLPANLTDTELMGVLGYRPRQFYTHAKAGKFDRFALVDPIGPRRWCGAAVQRYLQGERIPATRHFGGGRR